MTTYEEWIIKYTKNNISRGFCGSAVKEMQKQFPELIIVRGFCLNIPYGKSEHWWLVTPKGEIVDPTANQFLNVVEYIEYKEGMEIRVGKCINCGCDIYDTTLFPDKSTQICGIECEEELAKEFEKLAKQHNQGDKKCRFL